MSNRTTCPCCQECQCDCPFDFVKTANVVHCPHHLPNNAGTMETTFRMLIDEEQVKVLHASCTAFSCEEIVYQRKERSQKAYLSNYAHMPLVQSVEQMVANQTVFVVNYKRNKSNEVFTGTLEKQVPVGKGILDNDVLDETYTGEFNAEFQRHGAGTSVSRADCTKYEGQWQNGLKHGKGKESALYDSMVCVGTWYRDKKVGLFIATYPDAVSIYREYKNDQIVAERTMPVQMQNISRLGQLEQENHNLHIKTKELECELQEQEENCAQTEQLCNALKKFNEELKEQKKALFTNIEDKDFELQEMKSIAESLQTCLEEEKAKAKELASSEMCDMKCVACFEHQKNIVYQCGHMNYCHFCDANAGKTCPICREVILFRRKVYY